MHAKPRIWVLLGHRRGDNHQMLALAEGLRLPFETRSLRYRNLWALLLRLFPVRPYLLAKSARLGLQPPWPDLIIGIGRRSVAVARWIKTMSGGRTRIVRLGNPRADPKLFDLVITTPQYPVAPDENVLVLPVSMGRYGIPPKPSEQEIAWIGALPRPHLLVSVGGTTRYWTLPEQDLVESVMALADKASAAGGTLIVVPSPRTPASATEAIRASGAGCQIVAHGQVRYPVLLADADEHYVTADSVSMISEAVLTGRPVGLIPVELDREGRSKLGVNDFSASKRDLRRFWNQLKSNGSVGTVSQPKHAPVADPVETAAKAVRDLLGDCID